MKNTLQVLYLRVDSTTRSLSDNAISQVVIKILYAKNRRLSITDITNEYIAVMGKNMDKNNTAEKVKEILNSLEDANEIRRRGKEYYLSASKKADIETSYGESQNRLRRIVRKYFAPTESPTEVIEEWLSDMTILFFNNYNSEWVSDLSFSKSKSVKNCIENIKKQIKLETKKYEGLSKLDKELLTDKFEEFIMNKDLDVDAHLWEFGIASFSAKVIATFQGADSFSISTFSNSTCIIDTNVLMNIGLEGSEFYSSMESIGKVFKSLDIKPVYLNITKDEYSFAVGGIREEVLRNVCKFPYSVIKEADDMHVKTAVLRTCITEEDFERFFDETLAAPSSIEDKVDICLLDTDEIDDIITTSQNNEKKIEELNKLYKNVTERDKKINPLKHDVGLVEVAKHLRENDKYFILSQETSILEASKVSVIAHDLPLAIRLETLIKMLAIDNGGVDIDPTDYTSLFASLVRNGLFPDKNIFEIADLSRIQELEEQISQFPPERIKSVAKKANEYTASGMEEDKIRLELMRQIQGEKLKISDDLEDVQKKLTLEKQEKNRYKEDAQVMDSALRVELSAQAFVEYKRKLRNQYFKGIGIVVALIVLVFVVKYLTEAYNNTTAVIINIASTLLLSLFHISPKILNVKKNKKAFIDDYVQNKINEVLNSNK